MLHAYLPFYCSEVLRGPPEYGGKFILGSHHVQWGDAANADTRILIQAARDHGKSKFWCFGYPLWMSDRRKPGRVGYIFSASASQAEEHLEHIRQEIVGGGENGGPNPKLQHLLDHRGGRSRFPKDSARTLKFANNSEIRARGFGTRVRGGHPWWAVADDVGNDEWIWSQAVRDKDNDYFLSALRPMIVPGGQLIVVGTPFHSLDLYRILEDTGVYTVIKNPAITNGVALWPQRYNLARLAITKREMGSSLRFSREYLCEPISDEASLFPAYLFDAPGIKQPYMLGLPASHWKQLGMETYMGVDLAMSTSAGADFLVCFVMAVDHNGDRYIADIVRRKGLGFQAQIDLITQVSARYDCNLVFCEANQYQRVVSDEIVRTSDTPIKAFYTTGKRKTTASRLGMSQTYSANKSALDQGVPNLRMLLENGKLRLPWHPDTRPAVQNWIGEMQAFGWADGKLQGVGSHDDTVMAMWICDHACRIGGTSRSFLGDDSGKDSEVFGFGTGGPPAAGDSGLDELDFFGESHSTGPPGLGFPQPNAR
jgi:hypothetical protein